MKKEIGLASLIAIAASAGMALAQEANALYNMVFLPIFSKKWTAIISLF